MQKGRNGGYSNVTFLSLPLLATAIFCASPLVASARSYLYSNVFAELVVPSPIKDDAGHVYYNGTQNLRWAIGLNAGYQWAFGLGAYGSYAYWDQTNDYTVSGSSTKKRAVFKHNVVLAGADYQFDVGNNLAVKLGGGLGVDVIHESEFVAADLGGYDQLNADTGAMAIFVPKMELAYKFPIKIDGKAGVDLNMSTYIKYYVALNKVAFYSGTTGSYNTSDAGQGFAWGGALGLSF